jgi:hypothetical protein
MHLPKKINVCGKTVTVVTNKAHDGGSFDGGTYTIEVGTMDPDEVAENFIHEVGEAVMALRDFRFVAQKEEPENSDYRFVLTHSDYQLFAKDLAIALRGVRFPPQK